MYAFQKTRRIFQIKLYKSIRCYSKDICPPPPPKKKSGGGSGAIYTLGALVLAGGATIGYAKYDPDFRGTLVEYVPFTDTIIKFVFQEETSILGSLSNVYEGGKRIIAKSMTSDDKKREAITQDAKPYKGRATHSNILLSNHLLLFNFLLIQRLLRLYRAWRRQKSLKTAILRLDLNKRTSLMSKSVPNIFVCSFAR